MAILGLVFAFAFAPAGLVLSIIAMRRTKDTPDRTGYNLALVGTILGGFQTALVVFALVFYIFSVFLMFLPFLFVA
ncbi:MAG: DUF4190 domain-containing protein [Micrococcales bacterium]|nr:DUF4190 domain-containing protein [Micrococcales bacterium]